MSRTLKDQPFRIRFPEEETDSSFYGGGNCHCHTCGRNNASSYNRSIYLRYGIVPDEQKLHSFDKKASRRTLRRRLKEQLLTEETDPY